ncbi:hypothetical protein RND71_043337 [Anisodus tanguticus]|uniref:U4/U6.U5 tri-snRNP-associated protein 1 n=1 Tax=Anisodus tanguticus TaxID=243964 RepID=A0AAE1UU26_9SOLA|nr:hypothetical protein RND71_043337 [Anisodus tanguticus]
MNRKEAMKNQRYDDTDLLGLKVSHSESSFKEGKDVILTLKDSNVLDNEEDVLENVNIVDLEKSNKNVENKLKKPGYNPHEEPEFDIYGRYQKKSLLSKYDEEINGFKKESFRIGLDQSKRLEHLEEIKKVLAKEKNEVSLEVQSKVASEYYTEEEVIKFKKPKKLKKSKKNKVLTADSLLPLADDNNEDHGSRNKSNKDLDIEIVDEAFIEHQNILQSAIQKKLLSSKSKDSNSSDLSHKNKKIKSEKKTFSDMKVKEEKIDPQLELDKDEEEDDFQIPEEEIYGTVLEEDDLQKDLMKSLEKARKLKNKETLDTLNDLTKFAENIKVLNEDEIKTESSKSITFEKKSDVVINSTAEFCRNLGEKTIIKIEREEDELLDFEKDLLEEKNRSMEVDKNEDSYSSRNLRNKWNEVDFITEQPKTLDSIESKPILEEEPDVSQGIAGALKLAMKKGYLDKEIKKSNMSVKNSSLQAKNYTIEEKFYDDDKIRRRERYSGPVSEFKDLANYKPDVKLEYNDDNGRKLNAKEAFRVLSHKFHGKGPDELEERQMIHPSMKHDLDYLELKKTLINWINDELR